VRGFCWLEASAKPRLRRRARRLPRRQRRRRWYMYSALPLGFTRLRHRCSCFGNCNCILYFLEPSLPRLTQLQRRRRCWRLWKRSAVDVIIPGGEIGTIRRCGASRPRGCRDCGPLICAQLGSALPICRRLGRRRRHLRHVRKVLRLQFTNSLETNGSGN